MRGKKCSSSTACFHFVEVNPHVILIFDVYLFSTQPLKNEQNVKEATECMEPFGPLLECMKSHGMIEEEGNENEASGENDVTSDNNKTSNKA
mmetsp:Transcript_13577/g.18951  ORF Transcript_13577/g.18951 Transcript_13577/m.18951 type:complete len:92 (+) Transcript_13577:652-927(+)